MKQNVDSYLAVITNPSSWRMSRKIWFSYSNIITDNFWRFIKKKFTNDFMIPFISFTFPNLLIFLITLIFRIIVETGNP
jgi:hypothetical protein